MRNFLALLKKQYMMAVGVGLLGYNGVSIIEIRFEKSSINAESRMYQDFLVKL